MDAQQPISTAADLLGDIAPKLLELTEKVLFGDVWERPGLSKRDRSLITVSALISLNRTQQLPFHLERALANGLTRDELVEAIGHGIAEKQKALERPDRPLRVVQILGDGLDLDLREILCQNCGCE